MTSLSRQNYSPECEALVNKQINMELSASYAYLAMSAHFQRDTVAFPEVAKFFHKMSHEEREHAEKLIKYQNMRGGTVTYEDIPKPTATSFSNINEAMEVSLNMEKDVNKSLLNIHKVASEKLDAELQHFLEDEYLEEQIRSIKMFADYVTQTKRNGGGLGDYLFEKLSLKE